MIRDDPGPGRHRFQLSPGRVQTQLGYWSLGAAGAAARTHWRLKGKALASTIVPDKRSSRGRRCLLLVSDVTTVDPNDPMAKPTLSLRLSRDQCSWSSTSTFRVRIVRFGLEKNISNSSARGAPLLASPDDHDGGEINLNVMSTQL
jgi:hypothetical protein